MVVVELKWYGGIFLPNQFMVVYDGGGVERQTELWVPQTGGPLCTNTALTFLQMMTVMRTRRVALKGNSGQIVYLLESLSPSSVALHIRMKKKMTVRGTMVRHV